MGSRSQPKIHSPRKVDSRKKAASPSMASGAAEDVADEARVGRPVHAELELLHEPGHHADGHVDQEQGAEEAGQPALARGRPMRYQLVCRMATRKASPIVTGTNRKW